jgi:hypothetical protein
MTGFIARTRRILVIGVLVAVSASSLEAQRVAKDRNSDTTAILMASVRYVRRAMKQDTLLLDPRVFPDSWGQEERENAAFPLRDAALVRQLANVLQATVSAPDHSFSCVDAAAKCRFALHGSLIGLSEPAIHGDSARVIVYDFNPGDMNGSAAGSFSTAFLELHLVRSRGTWSVKRARSVAA